MQDFLLVEGDWPRYCPNPQHVARLHTNRQIHVTDFFFFSHNTVLEFNLKIDVCF